MQIGNQGLGTVEAASVDGVASFWQIAGAGLGSAINGQNVFWISVALFIVLASRVLLNSSSEAVIALREYLGIRVSRKGGRNK